MYQVEKNKMLRKVTIVKKSTDRIVLKFFCKMTLSKYDTKGIILKKFLD